MFPIVGLLLTAFLVPSGLPLLGMLFFGNLLKESGVTRRLAETARGPLIDIVTILLGLTVGASTQATTFLTAQSVKSIYYWSTIFYYCNRCRDSFCQVFQFVPKKRQQNQSAYRQCRRFGCPTFSPNVPGSGVGIRSRQLPAYACDGAQCSRSDRIGCGCRYRCLVFWVNVTVK